MVDVNLQDKQASVNLPIEVPVCLGSVSRLVCSMEPIFPTARSSQCVARTDLLLGVLRDVLDSDLLGVDLHEVQAGDILEVLHLEPEQQVLGAQAARDG